MFMLSDKKILKIKKNQINFYMYYLKHQKIEYIPEFEIYIKILEHHKTVLLHQLNYNIFLNKMFYVRCNLEILMLARQHYEK